MALNASITTANKYLLNNMNRTASQARLGDLLSGSATAGIDGTIIISGGFLTDSSHGTPAATYGNEDADGNTIFTITSDSQDGGYKIQLASSLVGKQVTGIVGSVGTGVAYNGGSPDLSASGSGVLLDAPCINSGTGEIWVVTQGADTTFDPAHFSGVVVSFVIVLTPA